MFYDLKLDDKSYSEIEADAVFAISKEYPEWTNHNPSDPGIMLLQLFSWLKEAQQYHLSRLGMQKRLKFLKLLGMEVRHMRPAEGAVYAEPGPEQAGKGLKLLKGTRFYAGDMAFETAEQGWVRPARLIGAYMLQGNELSRYQNIGSNLGKQMKLYPFGERPETGNQCYFVLDRGFSCFCQEEREKGYVTDIYFDICNSYEVARNPIDEDFIPLVRLRWEYFSTDGWEEAEAESDHTYGFLQSGSIRLRMRKDMALEEKMGAFELRVTLEENYYDTAPLIQNIYLNESVVKQQYSFCDYEDFTITLSGQGAGEVTLCSQLALAVSGETALYLKRRDGWEPAGILKREQSRTGERLVSFSKPDWAGEVLTCRLTAWERELGDRRTVGEGNAFANQEFDLNLSDILYDEFEIMVRDGAKGIFTVWHKVEDFDNCTPEEPAYILDLEEQKLIFGNCERGRAPDGEIRIIRLRTSCGKSGNIKADKIRVCEQHPGLLVKQYKEAGGGWDDETIDQCFHRFRQEMKEIRRGVTYADYEELVRKAPGLLILDSRVIAPSEWMKEGRPLQENQISIVVQTISYDKRAVRLNERYRQNLRQLLEKKKLIGTSIQILDPEYIGIMVYAEIAVRSQFPDAGRQIEDAVKAYLDERSWKIGSPVLSSTIYGIIDTLPCVWQVRSLSLNARGKGCRCLVNGDVALPPNGLAYLKELDFAVMRGEAEWSR